MCVYTHIFVYISNHSFFILSTIDGHLDCFLILAIVNSAAVNTEVQISSQVSIFVYFGYITRSGIAGS